MAILVFDVNETMLSMAPVSDALVPIFGDDPPAGEWFARLLHLSAVVDHVGAHRPFDELAVHALLRVAAGREVDLDRDGAREVAEVMGHLSPHDDVVEGLERLAAAGHRRVAFSNGSSTALPAQLAQAGLADLFDDVVSVEVAGWFKPDRRAYEGVASHLDAFANELTMVAAHDWDIAGAMATGMGGIFLERVPDSWHLPVLRPTTVTSMVDLVDVV